MYRLVVGVCPSPLKAGACQVSRQAHTGLYCLSLDQNVARLR